MKRLNVLYYSHIGDQDHQTTFSPLLECFIDVFIKHYLAQQICLLPAYFPDSEKPT